MRVVSIYSSCKLKYDVLLRFNHYRFTIPYLGFNSRMTSCSTRSTSSGEAVNVAYGPRVVCGVLVVFMFRMYFTETFVTQVVISG